ncbi:sugar ABC transporter permease [Vallitalea longa]|uniref:Sugar ABC transporter permease n=1 Tax=Vallitalea longa TaxID=2936439 RepID=A0A9W6DD64_9FIRM|nr:carbohydrate ABC transporter permease [Vallitalea longa]GKX27600.1 sugar ABC transporter permease [Vallitalea longa]
MNGKTKTKLINLLKGLLAWIISLIVITPFLIVLFNAFKTTNEALNMSLSLPKSIHLENFKKVWEVGNIPRSYMNSFLLSGGAVTISVICSSLCAFVLARNKTRVNRGIYIYFSLGLMFPVNMVTVVKVMRWLNLYNSRVGVIFLCTALILPLSVFLYYGFINSIPVEMDEAAIMDGASANKIFFSVIFPMVKPVTVTVVMINFLNVWNDFTIPLYMLPDPSKAVIVQQVYNFYGTFTASWNLVSVTILYAILPIIIIYAIGQKYIISGMVAGAVKG